MNEQINKKILENENYLNENKSKLIKILKNIRNLKISITTFTLAIVLSFTIFLILNATRIYKFEGRIVYEIIFLSLLIILSFFCIISILVKRRLVFFLLSFFSFVFIIYSIFLLFSSVFADLPSIKFFFYNSNSISFFGIRFITYEFILYLVFIFLLQISLLSMYITFLILSNKKIYVKYNEKIKLEKLLKKREKQESKQKAKLEFKQAKLKEKEIKQNQYINNLNEVNNDKQNNQKTIKFYNLTIKETVITITYILLIVIILGLIFSGFNKLPQLPSVSTGNSGLPSLPGFPDPSGSSPGDSGLKNIPKLIETLGVFMSITIFILLITLSNWILKLFNGELINKKHITFTKLSLFAFGILINFISLIIVSVIQSKTQMVLVQLFGVLFALLLFITNLIQTLIDTKIIKISINK